MAEIWKPVVGFERQYQVSNLGRVRSTDHEYAQLSRHGNYHFHRVKGRVLRPGRKSSGHLTVCLGLNNTRQVHALVMLAFAGKTPPGLEILHRNGISSDNRLSNLTWGTRSQNGRDKKWHAGAKTYKLSPANVAEIKELLRQKVPHSQIAFRFNISRGHVGNIARGRSHADI